MHRQPVRWRTKTKPSGKIYSRRRSKRYQQEDWSEETCRKFGYGVTTHKGQPVQVATYRDKSGRPVAQKIRTADKRFSIIGDAKGMTLLGSHLWTKGKILTITEGEIDAMSALQVQGHKWATVSLPNGAASAAKAIGDNWEYIAGFDTVILMFDQDEVGLRAAEAAAAVLPVGKGEDRQPAMQRCQRVSAAGQRRRNHQRDTSGAGLPP